MSNRRSGLTLLEVIIVVALMAILAALTLPSIDAMYADVRVDAGVDQIRAAWAVARKQAIDESRPYKFSIQRDGDGYRVSLDDSDVSASMSGDQSSSLTIEDHLPKGLTFSLDRTDLPADGDFVTLVTFRPDGSASDDTAITLKATGIKPRTINLRQLTGSVTVRRGDSK